MTIFLPVPVVLPLLTGIVAILLRRNQKWQERLSIFSLAVNLAFAISLLQATWDGSIFFHRMGLWPFPYGIILAADRLTGTMVCLAAAIVGDRVFITTNTPAGLADAFLTGMVSKVRQDARVAIRTSGPDFISLNQRNLSARLGQVIG